MEPNRCPELDQSVVVRLVAVNRSLTEALRAIILRTSGHGIGSCLIHREVMKIAENALSESERLR